MNQFAALKHRQQRFRRMFATALRAADYKRALACQKEIDRLEGILNALARHVRLIERQHEDYYRNKAVRTSGRP
jgi:transposase